jgi:hypothetical protein
VGPNILLKISSQRLIIDIAEIVLKLRTQWSGMLSFRPPPLYPGLGAPDSYRIGDMVDPKTVRTFTEKITLKSNQITIPSSFYLKRDHHTD